MDKGCHYFHFGLLVTGKGEALHLPKLFKSLAATGICSIKVIRKIAQLSPRTSPKQKLKMVGQGKIIPTKDEKDIGLPARRYLNTTPCAFVILIDDLEHGRKEDARQIFDRYRLALDTMLTEPQQQRAAVHFLVNMLEAYYFADAAALNQVLGFDPPWEDFCGDVETIRHPKNELKRAFPGFDEVEHGGQILEVIDIEHVLSRPDTCAWLRTLFAWCESIVRKHYPLQEPLQALALSERYCLSSGILSRVTRAQIEDSDR